MVNNTFVSGDNNWFVDGASELLSTTRVRLYNGYTIFVSPKEQFLTIGNGGAAWKTAWDFATDDVVAVPKREKLVTQNARLCQEWLGSDMNIAYILGQLTGDGSNGECIELATGENSCHEKIKQWVSANLNLRFSERKRVGIGECWYLRLFSQYRVGKRTRKTMWHQFIETCNLKKDCYHKEVPLQIIYGSDQMRAAYLAGLWDADGTLPVNATGTCLAAVTSVSPRLIQQVCRLLRHFGILHSISNGITICVWDTESLQQLLHPYLLVKQFRGRLLRGDDCGDFPKSLVFDAVKASGLSMKAFAAKHGIARIKPHGNFVNWHTAIAANVVEPYARKGAGFIYHRISECMEVGEHLHKIVDNAVVANGILFKVKK